MAKRRSVKAKRDRAEQAIYECNIMNWVDKIRDGTYTAYRASKLSGIYL